jgi:hypothetical protein
MPSHPILRTVLLPNNSLTGPLPPAWANSSLDYLVLSRNDLTGPALPPAWADPRALPHLRELRLDGNPGLGGRLPAALAWPLLEHM